MIRTLLSSFETALDFSNISPIFFKILIVNSDPPQRHCFCAAKNMMVNSYSECQITGQFYSNCNMAPTLHYLHRKVRSLHTRKKAIFLHFAPRHSFCEFSFSKFLHKKFYLGTFLTPFPMHYTNERRATVTMD